MPSLAEKKQQLSTVGLPTLGPVSRSPAGPRIIADSKACSGVVPAEQGLLSSAALHGWVDPNELHMDLSETKRRHRLRRTCTAQGQLGDSCQQPDMGHLDTGSKRAIRAQRRQRLTLLLEGISPRGSGAPGSCPRELPRAESG